MRHIKQYVYDAVMLNRAPFVRRDYLGNVLDMGKHVSASEITKCARELRFTKVGFTGVDHSEEYVDELLDSNTAPAEGYFERGDAIETWVVNRLRSQLGEGEFILFGGDDQISIEHGALSGTPDGLYVDLKDNYAAVLECKSTQNEVAAPKHDNKRQLLTNMFLMVRAMEDPLFAAHVKELLNGAECPPITEGTLFYVNSSNWLQIDTFTFEYNDKIDDAGLESYERAEMIVNANPDDIPFEGVKTGRCRWCKFKPFCTEKMQELALAGDEEIKEDIAKMERGMNIAPFQPFRTQEEIEEGEAKTLAWLRHRELRIFHEKEEKTHKDDAFSYLQYTANEEGRCTVGDDIGEFAVKISPVLSRKKPPNVHMMREDGIDVEKYMGDIDPYYMPTVKRIK